MVNKSAFFLMAVCLCLGSVQAAEVEVGADVNSAYVWRGMTLNDGLVVQPSIDVATPRGFGINVWGNLDVGDYDGSLEEGEFSEIEIRGSYRFSVASFECEVGYIEYLFPQIGETNTLTGTREVYASAEVPLVASLSAILALYYDFDEAEDIYATLGLCYGFDLRDAWRAEASAFAGYMGKDMALGAEGGLHDYTCSLSVTYDIDASMAFAASLAYTDTLDKDVLPEQDVNVHGGFSLAFGF